MFSIYSYMKKIDIHCHTSNRFIKDIIPESADLETINSEMKKYEIEKTNVLATYFPHKSSGISNFRLLHWIKENPHFMMFGSLDFEHYFYQGINELEELAEDKLIKGIKLYTCYQEIDLQSDKFRKILEVASTYSLPLMFHSGYSYSSMRKYNTMSVASLVKPSDLELTIKENPEIDIIISHLAKPFLEELIPVIKSNNNVYSDMSGLIDSKFEQKEIPKCVENIKRYLGECSPNKLLFGTDFPVQTHQNSLTMLEGALHDYSFTEQKLVYYDNARGLLKC